MMEVYTVARRASAALTIAAGFSQLVANGVLYLTPSPLSGLLEPPVHS
jgi:hypothetical protein